MTSAQRVRILIYIVAAILLCSWLMIKSQPPEFKSDIILTSEHYVIESTAGSNLTRSALKKCELLHKTYDSYFDKLFKKAGKGSFMAYLKSKKNFDPKRKMKLRLYRTRTEFKNASSLAPHWAEAYYLPPYCYQYIDNDADNPWHWMMHEATHQLNTEHSGFRQTLWLEEGIATYFGTSLIDDDKILLGKLDPATYPVWWMDKFKEYDSLDQAVEKLGIIRLKHVVTGKGGPFLNRYFNLYYVHWFSIFHFLNHYNNEEYRASIPKLILKGGSAKAFEKYIGKFEDIEKKWYLYHKILCRSLN